MAYTGAQLLSLQANVKRDPDGYRDEFLLQHRHYAARLALLRLDPAAATAGGGARELAELVAFVAQVSKCYPRTTAGFAPELMALLGDGAAALDAGLRRAAVRALILLRNRNQLDPASLLPLLFRLFSVRDKALRDMLARHIVADLKASNRKARNERLNRSVQSFLYSVLQNDDELAAKRSLAVLTELWRRNVWRDARTVNVIASAAFHRSPAVCLAALRFFLGQDAAASGDGDGGGSDDDDDAGNGAAAAAAATAAAMPSKREHYKAAKQGTASSKRKKKAKLARVVAAVKKAARRDAAAPAEGFAALHLLHDPQAFAERLFARLQGGREKWETRAAMMAVVSRAVGVHRLLLPALYPFLQKYVAPHTRDVTQVLAALVQATHALVPPDALAPVLRQLVDQFVHDRARPEVIVIGLKTVRELCLRCPLLMGPDLLHDLAAYRRFRDREVAAAARSVVALFREINPALLAKRDRGRGADMGAAPSAYGEPLAAARVDGADLLEQALLAGDGDSDGDGEGGSSGSVSGSGSSEDDSDEGDDDGSGSSGSGGDSESEACSASDAEDSGDSAVVSGSGSEDGDDGDDGADLRAAAGEGGGEGDSSGSGGSGTSSSGSDTESDSAHEAEADGSLPAAPAAAPKRHAPQPGSLADLKRQLAARSEPGGGGAGSGGGGSGGGPDALDPSLPIEAQRILGDDDFRRIRELKRRRMVEAAMARHGLKSVTKARAQRLAEAAEDEAAEALALAAARAGAHEATVAPDDLAGRKKRARDKAGRLASIMEGREGRDEFGSRAARKKQKTGSRSEREKQRAKAMPIAARIAQVRNRAANAKQRRNPKHFKGHVRGR